MQLFHHKNVCTKDAGKPFLSHKIFMVVRLAVRANIPKDSLTRDSFPKDSLTRDFLSDNTSPTDVTQSSDRYLLKIVTAVDYVHLT